MHAGLFSSLSCPLPGFTGFVKAKRQKPQAQKERIPALPRQKQEGALQPGRQHWKGLSDPICSAVQQAGRWQGNGEAGLAQRILSSEAVGVRPPSLAYSQTNPHVIVPACTCPASLQRSQGHIVLGSVSMGALCISMRRRCSAAFS